ncbi:TraM recognition domain-containing protein [Spiroplasma ixodetis]|uniref:TraD/TraG TraM recognition site domain-containing protein n=1 Tax=Spiroplasma ixodetis TaxID=2141 RepID=A0ABM8JN48_9MOLU
MKNDFSSIVKNHKVILFSLNSLDYPQLASNIGKLLIKDLKEFASIKPRNQQINIILDEFNFFASDSIINLINKTRSFNYQFFLCFQTINDLKTDNKDLTDTIFGNTVNIIAHNVKDPNSAEYIAKVFGAKTSQKITKQYDTKNKKSSKGSIREVEEYIVHQNDLKKLKVGQAYCKIILEN